MKLNWWLIICWNFKDKSQNSLIITHRIKYCSITKGIIIADNSFSSTKYKSMNMSKLTLTVQDNVSKKSANNIISQSIMKKILLRRKATSYNYFQSLIKSTSHKTIFHQIMKKKSINYSILKIRSCWLEMRLLCLKWCTFSKKY